jgi:D-amino-acid dehydrogenase
MAERHVAILGAGVVGAACALEALRAGWRVTLVEPAEAGGEQAASYGNAGWLSSHSIMPPATPGAWKSVPAYLADPLGPLAIRWYYLPRAAPWLLRYLASGSTPDKVARTAASLRTLLAGAPGLHARLAREAEVAHLVEHAGLLHAYRTRADYEADALGWRLRREQGIELVELEAAELRAREPDLDPRYGFGVFVPEAGRCINAGAYTAALAEAARVRGAEWRRDRALGFALSGGRLAAVLTTSGPLACDAAVVCAGAHSKALAAAAGDHVPLETERGYHAVITEPEAGPRTSVMAMDCKIIVNATQTGLRAAGQVEIAGLQAAPDWRRAHVLRELLVSMFPALPRKPPESRLRYWMGHRPSLPDGLPCIGYSRASRDVVHAFGHGHVGLGSSARTGRLVAQLLAGAEPEIPLAPFDPRRF